MESHRVARGITQFFFSGNQLLGKSVRYISDILDALPSSLYLGISNLLRFLMSQKNNSHYSGGSEYGTFATHLGVL